MKRIILTVIVLTITLAAAQQAEAQDYRIFSVQSVDGTNIEQQNRRGAWTAVRARDRITADVVIRIGENSALTVNDGSGSVKIGPNVNGRIGELVNTARNASQSQLERELQSVPMGTSSSSTSTSSTSSTTSSTSTTSTAATTSSASMEGRAPQDTANWDIAALDTAANVSYLTAIEKDVILETNMVRTNPRKYAELYIKPKLQYFDGKNFRVPGQITRITNEGAAAVNECVAALNQASSVGILTPERGLSLAAKDHANDQSRTGQTGHYGSDRSDPGARMKRHGTFGSSMSYGENIAYGDVSGRDIVTSLLIDDGVPDRGHRKNIMSASFTQTGVGTGTHTQYRTSCTITYARGYTSN